ncbi:unnamed protein product, partial [Rotaria sp. Silwood1]
HSGTDIIVKKLCMNLVKAKIPQIKVVENYADLISTYTIH